MKYKPYRYQRQAEEWIMEHPSCGLFLEMGLGKTVVTLTAIDRLIYERMEVDRVLVIAPLRVASTVWAQEAAKWEHTRHLRVARVLGSAEERKAALREDADIYVINRENVVWLTEYLQRDLWKFDMVVVDELSSFKSAQAARFRALRRMRPRMKRFVGLTGTPAPNGLIDLWAQVYLMDGGERLGKTLGGYRQRYFTEGRRNAQVVFNWVPKEGADRAIAEKLSDICVSMKAADYLTLPERLEYRVPVVLEAAAKAKYVELERNLVLPLEGSVVTAQTAAVVTGKLLQMAGGAVYDTEQKWHEIHRAKLDALHDLVEESQGQPMLVYYGYRHDLQRLLEEFPQARVLSTAADVENWNAGRIPMLLAHPDSAGHGLNLQAGGHIMVWFSLTWSLEKYQQANARLYRQGQGKPVQIYHLVAEGTMDEQVMRVLSGKERRQDALIEAVKARIQEAKG